MWLFVYKGIENYIKMYAAQTLHIILKIYSQQFILEKKLEYWLELAKNSKLMNYNDRTIAQIILALENSLVIHWVLIF